MITQIKKLKVKPFLKIFTAILFSALFVTPVSALSGNSEDRFSFRFEGGTVTDALREISDKSGIKISTNGVFEKEIMVKSYVNRNLDSILTDLLRRENCAVVWNYSKGNLHSIDLYSFDDKDIKRTASRPDMIRRTAGNSRPTSYSGSRNLSESNETGSRYSNDRAIRSRNAPGRSDSVTRSSAGNGIPSSGSLINKNASRRIISSRRSKTAGTSGIINRAGSTAGVNTGQGNIIKEEKENLMPQPPVESNKADNKIDSTEPVYKKLEPPPMPPGM